MMISWGNGNGSEKAVEIDVLKDEESRLEILRQTMRLSMKSENEYWKRAFSYGFLEMLAHSRKNKKDKNDSLAELARELLEDRKRILAPLEKIVEELESGE
jgi:uncharacterized coiled-coil DUF342 family protein